MSHPSTKVRVWLRRSLIALLCIPLTAIVVIFCGTHWFLFVTLRTVTDVDDYPQYVRSFRPGYAEHFPIPPPAASSIEFQYVPGFAQGGTTMKLHAIVTPTYIRDVRSRFEPLALLRWHGSERPATSPYALPDLHLPTSVDDHYALPADYEVLLLRASPQNRTNPEFSGVAISDERNAILFWAEDW